MKNKAVTLPGGIEAMPHDLKCHIRGCRRRKHGYLTVHRSNLGGGAFYDRSGRLLADLRDQHFVCSEHGIADGSAPFLIEDRG